MKLIFHLSVDFGDDITLIANNHLDLENYLRENYDWDDIEVKEDSVKIIERDGYEAEYATLQWAKMV